MSAEDLEWAAETLVEAERRRCISRVCRMETEDAVAKGENFGSDIRRLKMTVVLHSGEVQQRTLFYKAMPTSHNQRLMHKNYGTFLREARVYTDVLSEMESMIMEKESNPECLWPTFYGTKPRYEGLLFEDLSVKGYKMPSRHKGVDFEHCLLIIRSLAKFHALAAIIRERGDLNIEDYPFFLRKDLNLLESYYQPAFDDLAKIIETKWKPEWLNYVEPLRKLSGVMKKEFGEFPGPGGSEFYTLNHGDFWLNNMLFRYGKDGQPTSVRFIDFQMCNYNTPVHDLYYFLHSTPNLEARKRRKELIQGYHSSLEENLQTFGYSGKVPSLAEIQNSMEKMGAYGLGLGLLSLPLVMAPKGTVLDMEGFSSKEENKEGPKSFYSVYSDDETFIATLQVILREGREKGYL